MQNKLLIASVLAATAMFTVAGCSSNQAVKTTDGKTIVTDGKPQVDDDTGLVSYKTPKPVKLNRLTVTRLNQWASWITKKKQWHMPLLFCFRMIDYQRWFNKI